MTKTPSQLSRPRYLFSARAKLARIGFAAILFSVTAFPPFTPGIFAMEPVATGPATTDNMTTNSAADPEKLAALYAEVRTQFEKLRPQSIPPAEGFIKYDYVIPAGYYRQLWDWDGFFIGCHLASIGKPQYLK
jgi:hypothetical protein